MKVLFLSNEQFLPLSGGGSVGNYKIVGKLVERGYDVTVATPLYLGVEEVRRIEAENNIRLRQFSPYYIHKNVSYRGPKYLLYGMLFTFHLLRLLVRERYDVIFIRNCLLAFPAVLFKPFAGSMYVVSMTDFLTGFLHDNRAYPRPVVKAMFLVERAIPRLFDLVFVITEEMKRMLVGGGCHPSKIHVTYDGVDTNIFDPQTVRNEDVEAVRQRYGVGGRIVLFHGTIDDHAQGKLRDVIKLVTGRRGDVTFILLGQGKRYDDLKAELESDRVRFPGYVRHEDIPKYAAAADVGVIPYEHNFNSDIIITLKLLEYLAMGLPVASTNLKSIRELFGAYDFIRLSETTEEFADDVISLAEHGKSDEAAELMRSQYSWDNITTKIVETVERIYKTTR